MFCGFLVVFCCLFCHYWNRVKDWDERPLSENYGWLCSFLFLEGGIWPFVLWTEAIFRANDIVSETDKLSVVLFGFQVVGLLLPDWKLWKK